ncbi:hypothetical protein F5879DRAFT_925614 [Lentinula edodes]|nr:hypothetical protein F5879DRAFT_925614 [Lentinula edodes]
MSLSAVIPDGQIFAIRKQPYDRIELRSPSPTRPPPLDRRLLGSSGASRTPRTIHRSSPYPNCRSLSPDPSFRGVGGELCAADAPVSAPSTQTRTTLNHIPKVVRFAEATASDLFPDVPSAEDIDDKIPKPLGEVGQSSRGGYNLRIKLEWTDDRFNKVQEFINGIVEEKLDCSYPFHAQALVKIKEVQKMALQEYPFLNEYHSNWVVDDFIKYHLKRWKQQSSHISD